MQKAGVLSNWQIIINPHMIGCEAASFDLSMQHPEARTFVISQLKLIRGIIYILPFFRDGLRVMTYYPNDEALERQIALMESICNGSRSMFWKDVFPPWNMKMTKTDWLIIATLMKKNPRKKLSMIAHDAGVSSKTLSRRIHRMTEHHVFFLDAGIDVSKLSGSACMIFVQYGDKSKKRLIDDLVLKTLGNATLRNTAPTYHSWFSIHCENNVDAERTYQWIRGLDGVEEAKMGILEEKITVDDWLVEEIESRAKIS